MRIKEMAGGCAIASTGVASAHRASVGRSWHCLDSAPLETLCGTAKPARNRLSVVSLKKPRIGSAPRRRPKQASPPRLRERRVTYWRKQKKSHAGHARQQRLADRRL